MDANVNGLRLLLDYARSQRATAGRAVEGFLFFSSSEIYGDPTPGAHPDARDVPRQRLVHRSARVLRRVEALRRDAVRQLRAAARPAGHDRAAVQQLRAGPQDHRSAGASRTSPATSSRAATSSLLSDGSPTRTFCYVADAVVGYYKVLVTRTARRGVQHRHRGRRKSPWPSWPSSIAALARELFGYAGQVVRRASPEADYLVDNPNRRCPIIDKARDELGYEPAVVARRGPRGARCSGTAENQRRSGRLMSVSIVGRGLRRPRHRRVPGRAAATRSSCVDVDRGEGRRDQRAASSPIHEPGLDELLARNVGRRLRATTDLAQAVARVRAHAHRGRHAVRRRRRSTSTLSSRRARRRSARRSPSKAGYHVVVVKSTVVPGTTDGVVPPLLEEASGKRAGDDFGVGMNPEFLTEGRGASTTSCIPTGSCSGASTTRTHATCSSELYAAFAATCRDCCTNTATAEMIKYASNALLATMISFSNEIGNLCAQSADVDVVDVMRGVHLLATTSARRAGRATASPAPIASFLEAGCGFGGSCLPKDVRALIAEGSAAGARCGAARGARGRTTRSRTRSCGSLERAAGDLDGTARHRARRGVQARHRRRAGVARDPDRPSDSLDRGARVTLHDPVVPDAPGRARGSGCALEPDLEGALASADVVVLVTRWDDYRGCPALLAAVAIRSPSFVDGRRMLDKSAFPRYVGIGARLMIALPLTAAAPASSACSRSAVTRTTSRSAAAGRCSR